MLLSSSLIIFLRVLYFSSSPQDNVGTSSVVVKSHVPWVVCDVMDVKGFLFHGDRIITQMFSQYKPDFPWKAFVLVTPPVCYWALQCQEQ